MFLILLERMLWLLDASRFSRLPLQRSGGNVLYSWLQLASCALLVSGELHLRVGVPTTQPESSKVLVLRQLRRWSRLWLEVNRSSQSADSDIFFIHERGARMAIWNFALATGATMGSVIGGYIAEDIGWRWNFGLAAIMLGLLWAGFFFFLPETVFNRDIKYNLDQQSHEDLSGGFEKNAEGDVVQEEVAPAAAPRQSWAQQLKPWTGNVYDHTSMVLFCLLLHQISSRLPSVRFLCSSILRFAGPLFAMVLRSPGSAYLELPLHKYLVDLSTTLLQVKSA
jgi:hypothetical protein